MLWFSIIKTDGGSAGHFAQLYDFQVSEWKYLMGFITRLVLLEFRRWWKEEHSVLKRSSPDISEDQGLITFSCKVKDEEPWDPAILSWHKTYVLLVATEAMIRLLEAGKKRSVFWIYMFKQHRKGNLVTNHRLYPSYYPVSQMLLVIHSSCWYGAAGWEGGYKARGMTLICLITPMPVICTFIKVHSV